MDFHYQRVRSIIRIMGNRSKRNQGLGATSEGSSNHQLIKLRKGRVKSQEIIFRQTIIM